MRSQRLVSALILCRLNLQKLGGLYFVPPVMVFVLLPLLSWGYLSFYGLNADTLSLIFGDFQRFLPFAACWWILFGLSDYAEGRAKELLTIYRKSLLADFALLFLWYILHTALLFSLYALLLETYWIDFLLIFMECGIFTGISFFLLLATKSLLVPFLALLFYEIFAFLSNFGLMQYVNIFSVTRVTRLSQLLWPYLPLFILSILLVLLGNRLYGKKH